LIKIVLKTKQKKKKIMLEKKQKMKKNEKTKKTCKKAIILFSHVLEY
jgi:hypothetical protein